MDDFGCELWLDQYERGVHVDYSVMSWQVLYFFGLCYENDIFEMIDQRDNAI
jgi:hypothetical protein